MILVIDVGNTNTEVGAFRGNDLVCSWRMMTKTPRTSDEFAVAFRGFLGTDNLDAKEVEDVQWSTVSKKFSESSQCA